MKVLIKLATVICAVGSFAPAPALALNAISSGSVSNNYLFIENAIDSEYYSEWNRARSKWSYLCLFKR